MASSRRSSDNGVYVETVSRRKRIQRNELLVTGNNDNGQSLAAEFGQQILPVWPVGSLVDDYSWPNKENRFFIGRLYSRR